MNANKKAKSVLAALLAGMMVFASACNQPRKVHADVVL